MMRLLSILGTVLALLPHLLQGELSISKLVCQSGWMQDWSLEIAASFQFTGFSLTEMSEKYTVQTVVLPRK